MEDRAALEREHAIGEREHQVEIVLDDHDRDVPAQAVEHRKQFLHHGRRETLERLVEQQEAHIAGESARGIMALTMDGIAVGNGILTVENEAQALVRADPKQGNKGAGAAEAAMALLELQERFQ